MHIFLVEGFKSIEKLFYSLKEKKRRKWYALGAYNITMAEVYVKTHLN